MIGRRASHGMQAAATGKQPSLQMREAEAEMGEEEGVRG